MKLIRRNARSRRRVVRSRASKVKVSKDRVSRGKDNKDKARVKVKVNRDRVRAKVKVNKDRVRVRAKMVTARVKVMGKAAAPKVRAHSKAIPTVGRGAREAASRRMRRFTRPTTWTAAARTSRWIPTRAILATRVWGKGRRTLRTRAA